MPYRAEIASVFCTLCLGAALFTDEPGYLLGCIGGLIWAGA